VCGCKGVWVCGCKGVRIQTNRSYLNGVFFKYGINTTMAINTATAEIESIVPISEELKPNPKKG
jgi:hypothetical protein